MSVEKFPTVDNVSTKNTNTERVPKRFGVEFETRKFISKLRRQIFNLEQRIKKDEELYKKASKSNSPGTLLGAGDLLQMITNSKNRVAYLKGQVRGLEEGLKNLKK